MRHLSFKFQGGQKEIEDHQYTMADGQQLQEQMKMNQEL